MLRIFLSSPSRNIGDSRKSILDQLSKSFKPLSMEEFGSRSTPAQIVMLTDPFQGLITADVCISLLTIEYGWDLKECQCKEICDAICPYKSAKNNNKINDEDHISYAHCELRYALAKKIPCIIYRFGNEWKIFDKLPYENYDSWNQINLESLDCEKLGRGKQYNFILNKLDFDESEFNGFEERQVMDVWNKLPKLVNIWNEVKDDYVVPILDADNLNKVYSTIRKDLLILYINGQITFNDFIGRNVELQKICDKLDDNQPILIWGVGGIGKTTIVGVALLLEAFNGRNIIIILKHRNWILGSGYANYHLNTFVTKLNSDETVTLETVKNALNIDEPDWDNLTPDNKKLIIENYCNKTNVLLFIDDIHETDINVQDLLKFQMPLIATSKWKLFDVSSSLRIGPMNEADTKKLIVHYAGKYNQNSTIVDKHCRDILLVSKRHPLFVNLIVKNLNTIVNSGNFEDLKSIILNIDGNDSTVINNVLNQLIHSVLTSEDAMKLLILLSIITENSPMIFKECLVTAFISEVQSTLEFDNLIVKLHNCDFISISEDSVTRKIYYSITYHQIADLYLTQSKTTVNPYFKSLYNLAVKYYQSLITMHRYNSSEKITEAGYLPKSTINLVIFYCQIISGTKKTYDSYIDFIKTLTKSTTDYKLLIKCGQSLLSRDKLNLEKQCYIHYYLGVLNHKLYHYNLAIVTLVESLQILKRMRKTPTDALKRLKLDILHELIILYTNIHEYDKSQDILNELSKSLDSSLDISTLEHIQINFERSKIYVALRQITPAKETLCKAVNLSQDLPRPRLLNTEYTIIKCYLELGLSYRIDHQYTKAIKILDDALDLVNNINDNSVESLLLLVKTLNLLAKVHTANLEYDLAKSNLNQAIVSIEKLSILNNIGRISKRKYENIESGTYSELGKVYFSLHDYNKAELYFNKSRIIREELIQNDSLNRDAYEFDLVMICLRLGQVYTCLHNFNQACTFLKTAFHKIIILYDRNESAHQFGLGMTLYYIGQYQLSVGDFNKAKEMFEKDHGIFKSPLNIKSENDYAYVLSLIGLGKANLELKFYEEAKILFETACDKCNILIERDSAHMLELISILNGLGKACLNLNDNDNAKKYFEKSFEICNELCSRDKVHEFELCLTNYEFGKLYLELNDYDLASKYLNSSLILIERFVMLCPSAHQSYKQLILKDIQLLNHRIFSSQK